MAFLGHGTNYTAQWRSWGRAINYTAQWRSAQCPSDTMQASLALSRPQDAHSFAGCFQHPASPRYKLRVAGRSFICRALSVPGHVRH